MTTPVLSVVPAGSIDDTLRHQLVEVVNAAFVRHGWLFPGTRTSLEEFPEETEGSELILLHEAPDRAVAAMAMIHPDEALPDALYLGMVVVAPQYQGRAYGEHLLRAAEEVARQRSFQIVKLVTVVELGNVAYWTRYGFSVVTEEHRPEGYWGAMQPYRYVTMTKRLVSGIQ